MVAEQRATSLPTCTATRWCVKPIQAHVSVARLIHFRLRVTKCARLCGSFRRLKLILAFQPAQPKEQGVEMGITRIS
jgi:hypothetical protein